jgi:GH3 auxin-responsive promoter
MAIIGKILKQTFELRSKLPKIRKVDSYKQQEKVLKKLLATAEFTSIGQHYNFSKIVSSKDVVLDFQNTVPTHDYNSMFKNWWHRSVEGEASVCWPGKVKYFALSSGTSESASKYIPVTSQMLRAIKKSNIRQFLMQGNFDLPKGHFNRGALMIGGSTDLNFNGSYYEDDFISLANKYPKSETGIPS